MPVNVGDVIPYVICEVEGAKSLALRAFHPSLVIKAKGALKIDTMWYLTQQILPPIGRLCKDIAGTDMTQLADCLGLDGRKYQQLERPSLEDEVQTAVDDFHLADHEAFSSQMQPLSIQCRYCQVKIAKFPGVWNGDRHVSGLKCPTPRCPGVVGPETARDLAELYQAVRR